MSPFEHCNSSSCSLYTLKMHLVYSNQSQTLSPVWWTGESMGTLTSLTSLSQLDLFPGPWWRLWFLNCPLTVASPVWSWDNLTFVAFRYFCLRRVNENTCVGEQGLFKSLNLLKRLRVNFTFLGTDSTEHWREQYEVWIVMMYDYRDFTLCNLISVLSLISVNTTFTHLLSTVDVFIHFEFTFKY